MIWYTPILHIYIYIYITILYYIMLYYIHIMLYYIISYYVILYYMYYIAVSNYEYPASELTIITNQNILFLTLVAPSLLNPPPYWYIILYDIISYYIILHYISVDKKVFNFPQNSLHCEPDSKESCWCSSQNRTYIYDYCVYSNVIYYIIYIYTINIWIWTYIYIYIYIYYYYYYYYYVYVCTYTYVYIYIYMHILYVCVYIHMHPRQLDVAGEALRGHHALLPSTKCAEANYDVIIEIMILLWMLLLRYYTDIRMLLRHIRILLRHELRHIRILLRMLSLQ